MSMARHRIRRPFDDLKLRRRWLGDEGLECIREQAKPLLQTERKYIAQVGVGVDMELSQQQLGAFDHLVTQGWGQGLQTIRSVVSPKTSLGDANSLVAHEAFEAYRSSGQVRHAFALSRQHHAAHQSEWDDILRVAVHYAPHDECAYRSCGVAQPGRDLRLRLVGKIVEMPGRIGAQRPVQQHRRIRLRCVQAQVAAEDVAPRRVHVQEAVGHRRIGAHAGSLNQQLGHPAKATESRIDLARLEELLDHAPGVRLKNLSTCQPRHDVTTQVACGQRRQQDEPLPGLPVRHIFQR